MKWPGSYLINCAGLHADHVARMAGERPDCRIVPFRGEYFRLRSEREYLVRNLIYPVPDPRFPFLGVHLTRLINGGIDAGPNAILATAREGYSRSDALHVLNAPSPGATAFLAIGDEIVRLVAGQSSHAAVA